MDREKTFTIGQFAALHHINKKTLMWYDQIGLFKPAVIDRDNGYRYYTYQQSPLLETIRMLRELDMSIAEIKGFLEGRSTGEYVRLLGEKIREVDDRIAKLRDIRHALSDQNDRFTHLLHTDLSQIAIVERKAEYLYVVASDGNLTVEDEIESVIRSVKKHHFRSLHETTYGSLISVASLLDSEFDNYDGLFMKAPGPGPSKEIHIKPAGHCLLAYSIGSWDRLPQRYREILQYAKDRNLRLAGYAYETGVNEMTINSMEEYITQIEIPIESEPG